MNTNYYHRVLGSRLLLFAFLWLIKISTEAGIVEWMWGREVNVGKGSECRDSQINSPTISPTPGEIFW